MSLRTSERGTASLELALVTPALMLLVLGVLQFGLWYHAEHVAQTAATEAARTAAAEGGSAEAAEARAMDVLGVGLGRSAEDPNVRVSLDGETARVNVSARIAGLLPIPGLSSFGLRAEASAYRERFRPADDSP